MTTIERANQLYESLKKDNLPDAKIRKIAKILEAFTIDDHVWH